MKYVQIYNTDLKVSRIALGCMRLRSLEEKQVDTLIGTALEQGINFFDHADIYGGGKSEELFAKAMASRPGIRQKVVIQSKCGITGEYYDFSKEHILSSVDGILKRLNTDYLDVLLLHRPDLLMEPEEVAFAFDTIKVAGKVRYFGVSNQNPFTMRLLSRHLNQRLVINQVQFGLAHTPMLDTAIHANMFGPSGVDRDGGILEYCRLHDMTVQAWSPFQYGMFEGNFLESEKYAALNAQLRQIADHKGVSVNAVAVAWILRHPAHIQAIVGTTNPEHLKELCRAADTYLSREEWYMLYKAAGNKLP